MGHVLQEAEDDGLELEVPDGPMSARASSDVRDRLLDLRVDTAAELIVGWDFAAQYRSIANIRGRLRRIFWHSST